MPAPSSQRNFLSPGSTRADIRALVEKRGLRIRTNEQRPGEHWGMLLATRA